MAEAPCTAGSCSSTYSDLLENGKNKTKIYCQRCSSLVLSPSNAEMVEKEFFLPHMYKKNQAKPSNGEDLKAFWLVTDMYTFDNVGFTNTVDSIKYLICADCEIGPIGWHDVSDKRAYYIAVERVKHE
ncbi:guanine nucleotide exchange factor MSS4-like [Babylonia areolata]|uniref:guanine nucleotide exchange factor MSS4-like n=1 Tax=Babylonia areolata TaxID=304850 RepID=UPI003FD42B2A